MRAGLIGSVLAAALAGGATARPAPPFAVEEATIAGVHAAIAAHRLTCRGLVDAYLARIAAYDKAGPALNALVVVNPEATREADAQDRAFARGGFVGPLHCTPMIVKDNFETHGLQTTDGSLAFAGYLPSEDATLVARAKAAGGIVLAKSNMAEWAFSPVETVSSILPGYTKNPYALDRVTAGSSGGTAAAIAASLGLVGFGSDTGDSIRGPSSHTALVGIRSTMGLASRAGVFPLVLRADVAGPITRTVADTALVLHTVAGYDPRDPATETARGHALPAPAAMLDAGALKGARIGVLHEAYDRASADPEVLAVFQATLAKLRAAGAVVIDPATVEGLDAVRRDPTAGPCMGFRYDLNAFLKARAGRVPYGDLSAIVASGKFHPSVEKRLEDAAKAPENGPETAACQADDAFRARFRETVLRTMDRLRLDAFAYPTWSNPPRLIGDLNTPGGDNSQVFAPTTGMPAVNVPMGWTRNGTLPVGLTLLGRMWADADLLRYAYAFEQATHARRPPASAPPLRR